MFWNGKLPFGNFGASLSFQVLGSFPGDRSEL